MRERAQWNAINVEGSLEMRSFSKGTFNMHTKVRNVVVSAASGELWQCHNAIKV